MKITVTPTSLSEVKLVEPRVFQDARGAFFESFNAQEFAEAIGEEVEFVQDNQSLSRRNVLRGLHYQLVRPQGKLVRAIAGEIFDVAVDIRAGSPNFGKWTGAHLSADNKKQLWIPGGFAHGFLVLSESAEVLYKSTDYWYLEHERFLLWSDPQIGIEWPLGHEPVLSARDAAAARLCEAEVYA